MFAGIVNNSNASELCFLALVSFGFGNEAMLDQKTILLCYADWWLYTLAQTESRQSVSGPNMYSAPHEMHVIRPWD